MSTLDLRRASPADIPFVMATERKPGFEKMVGRWTEEEHQAAISSPKYAYLIGTVELGSPAAFTIIRDLDDAHGNVCLKRIAVATPGQGLGSAFLGAVITWVFTQTSAHRFWLDVLVDNGCARHVYASHGFAEEGIMCEAYQLPDATRIDLVLMSLVRPDWHTHLSE